MTSAFLLKKNKREKEGFKNLKPSFLLPAFKLCKELTKF